VALCLLHQIFYGTPIKRSINILNKYSNRAVKKDSSGPEEGPVAACCEHGDKKLGSTQCEELPE